MLFISLKAIKDIITNKLLVIKALGHSLFRQVIIIQAEIKEYIIKGRNINNNIKEIIYINNERNII